jgi:pimeloyl-ACP methyl ester carboxylesterase
MSDNWVSLGKEFSKNHKVYILDQRNHGQSPHSEYFNYDVLLDDLSAFIYEKRLNKVSIIGHSMGGKVAMRFAIHFPERVSKICVADIAPKTYNASQFYVYTNALRRLDLSEMNSRKEIDEHLSITIPENYIRAFLLKNIKRNAVSGFSWKINLDAIRLNLNEITSSIAEAKKARIPALFVTGGLSDYVLPEDHSQIYRLFPEAKIVTIPNATHWLHADRPKQFYATVNSFLSS